MRKLRTSVYTVPTDRPEADGTIAWDKTTMLLVEVEGDDGMSVSASPTPRRAPRRW